MTDRELGCIDPHGMYPFPASRDVCPKCQAIRERQAVQAVRERQASLRRGLPYGWWKTATFWDVVMLLGLALAMALIIAAWFLDWKPVW